MGIKEKMEELRGVIDAKEALNAQVKELSKRETQLELDIRHQCERDGIDKLTAGGLSVSVTQKMRAKCEPDRWADVMRWAVESGNGHVFHRRMTDAKVIELIDNGIALPEGLTVEGYSELSVRRI